MTHFVFRVKQGFLDPSFVVGPPISLIFSGFTCIAEAVTMTYRSSFYVQWLFLGLHTVKALSVLSILNIKYIASAMYLMSS